MSSFSLYHPLASFLEHDVIKQLVRYLSYQTPHPSFFMMKMDFLDLKHCSNQSFNNKCDYAKQVGLINAEVTITLWRSLHLGPRVFPYDSMLFPECSKGAKIPDNFTRGAASNKLWRMDIGLSSKVQPQLIGLRTLFY